MTENPRVDRGQRSSLRRAQLSRPLIFVLSGLVGSATLLAQTGTDGTSWRHYGGDLGGTKYAPLSQIRESNLERLEIRWRWSSPDSEVSLSDNVAFEATPILVGNVLYASTSYSQVAAINAATGQTHWIYDSGSFASGPPPNNGFLHRGVAYWESGATRTIYMATGDARLIALNADNGVPRSEFGNGGVVDLRAGIRSLDGSSFQFGSTSPPIVVGDAVIVGSAIHDGVPQPEWPPGDVRAYDAQTGALLWTFRTIPQPGELGNETWEDGSWATTGGANVWAPMTADPELGYVYLPVSAPSNHFYGGHRKGDNLFANSIVCLDAETGARVWHFQLVHHDVWDYDIASPPNLLDLVVDGRSIKAVAIASKQGYVYVFDRVTGQPVWPIEEVAVPPSTVPGERLSPTQPIPTRPPPFTEIGATVDELIDFTPSARAQAEAILQQYDYGGLYTPPSQNGAVIRPGIGGGANWGGSSVDPRSGTLFVTDLGSLPYVIRLVPTIYPNYWVSSLAEPLYGPAPWFFLFKPPWGRITAYDLNTGDMRWSKLNAPGDGITGSAASLATEDLLFYVNRGTPFLRIFRGSDGALLHSVELPARGTGAPMSYLLGDRQYVVVAVGQRNEQMELVALSLTGDLPDPDRGTAEFSLGTTTVQEDGSPLEVTVHRLDGNDGAVSVDVVTASESATEGEDFVALSQTVAWSEGDSESKKVSVDLINDAQSEPDETFRVELTNPVGGISIGHPSQVDVTVVDDDIGPCEPDAQTVCLNDGRFRARVRYATSGGDSGSGLGSLLTGNTAVFTFFDPDNIEVVVKVLRACGPPYERYWLFATGLSDVEIELEVADPVTQVIRIYSSPLGEGFAPVTDTAAFSCIEP